MTRTLSLKRFLSIILIAILGILLVGQPGSIGAAPVHEPAAQDDMPIKGMGRGLADTGRQLDVTLQSDS